VEEEAAVEQLNAEAAGDDVPAVEDASGAFVRGIGGWHRWVIMLSRGVIIVKR